MIGSQKSAAFAVVLPGETVVWSADAPSGIRLQARDVFLIPFSILWCGFAIFWESAAVSSGPIFMKVWGLPFVAVGLYFVFGRFLADAWLRSRTSYAVTDRAAYVTRTAPFAAMRRYAASALDAVTLEARDDLTGTIRFVPQAQGRYANPWATPSLDVFEGIADARRVYEYVAAARTKD